MGDDALEAQARAIVAEVMVSAERCVGWGGGPPSRGARGIGEGGAERRGPWPEPRNRQETVARICLEHHRPMRLPAMVKTTTHSV